jgi:ABC-type transport system involved in multi-copper enzyme maturation permease subunit
MRDQIAAEILKIRSTRTTLGLLTGLVFLTLMFTILAGTLSPMSQLLTEQNQLAQLSIGSDAGIFAALAGIMLFTSEYRFGTIRPTFLFNPSRNRIFGSKVVAGALAGFTFGVIGEGLSLGISLIILKARGIPVTLSGANFAQLVAGAVIGAAMWGAIGVGVGAIIPNQVGAIISLLAWGFVVENTVFALLPAVGRYLPVHAQDSMMGLTTLHLLSTWEGVAVLIVWTAGLGAVGISLLRRRDVL